MATEKQVAWLQKLAKWKGVEIDANRIKELDNGQLDEVFEHLKDLKVTKEPKKVQVELPKASSFNPQRFGLVYKIIRTTSHPWASSLSPGEIINVVVVEYNLATEAENAVKRSLISVEPDADFLYEMARDRALIADGVM